MFGAFLNKSQHPAEVSHELHSVGLSGGLAASGEGEMEEVEEEVIFAREFSMPSRHTFSMPPVERLLDKWLDGQEVIVDPFAGQSARGTITNDLSLNSPAQSHMLADGFVEQFDVIADAVLFDPPYSPRQISECYQQVGMPCGKESTQSAALYKRVKDGLHKILRPGGIAICCGWNSVGFGITRGYELLEVLLVTHGAAHNDTIVTVERKS